MTRSTWMLILGAAPLAALIAPAAQAAETGAVRGQVVDPSGLAVPGAAVTLYGPGIAGELAATTDEDGRFVIFSVPPGVHTLRIVMDGFQPREIAVQVRLDETSYVPVTLQMADTAGEVVVVEDVLPVIDSTRSAFSTELGAETIQNLPVGRSYQSVVNMLPGVYGRVDTVSGGPGNGNPSVRGEGQYGNNYYIDGISTRDPATKTFGVSVNFDAIQDIQVYTDGLPAEFGQATGMLVNVVLKDGGDEHHGTAGYWLSMDASSGEYMIADLETHQEVPTAKRDFMNHEVSLTAGGPIVKEKLWYFAAADLGIDNITYEGQTVPQTTNSYRGLAKLTWFPTDSISVQYMGQGSLALTDNYITSSQFDDSAQLQYRSWGLTHIGTIRWRGESTEVEVKGSRVGNHIDVIPMSGDLEAPQIFDYDTGMYSGNGDSFDYNTRTRTGVTAKVTQIVDDLLGHHKLKAGAEYFRLTDSRELIFTGGEGTLDAYDMDGNPATYEYQGITYGAYPSAGFPCTAPDYQDCYTVTSYESAGALGHVGNVMTFFGQDDWQPFDALTINAGVRVDREQLLQNEGAEVLDQWMVAPRVGLAWDVTRDSKTLVSANFGQYYDVNGNDFASWGDTRSAFVVREYQWNEDLGGYQLVWEQDPALNPLIYDPDLKPYHMNKGAIQVKREILPMFAVGVRGILSSTVDIPEDIDLDLDYWYITNSENKRRDYRALEFTAEKKLHNNWQLLASYTLSESKGHMPGQFELSSGGSWGSDGNNVGVYLDQIGDRDERAWWFDNGYGWLVDGLDGLGYDCPSDAPTTDADGNPIAASCDGEHDDQGYYGYLPYHSFHNIKINASYTFNFGTTVGLVYEFDSGHAWQKRGMVELYGDYYAFPEGRGSRFMPPVHYIDARIAHAVQFGDGRSVEVSLDVFNLLDFDTPITYYENDDENFGLTLYRQSPRSIRAGLKVVY